MTQDRVAPVAEMNHQVLEELGLGRKPEIGAPAPDRLAGPRQIDDHTRVIAPQIRNDLPVSEAVEGKAMDHQQCRPAADDPIGNARILIAKVPERLFERSSLAYDHLQVIPDSAFMGEA